MFEKLKKRLAARWGFQEAPARDPKKVTVRRLGQALRSGGADFEDSLVDLAEITRAYNTDSYIKRAVDKHAELIFKAGWDLSGKNEAASEYVWTRLKLIAEMTGQPTDEFFKEVAHNLVLYGNAFVVKQRTGNMPPGINAQGYLSNKPVLGYFVLPPTTIQISRDETGRILEYQQDTGGGDTISIRPENMVHFYYKRPTGRAFGMPYIFTVLDDVKMLRQIEENIARLIYRNLFPLYQYKVGLDKPGFEATPEEIEELRDQIRDMPMDGGIVVPERHDISVVSNSSSILNADPYLKYFRQRVFSGLGVSDIAMGIGDTANRGTADNLSAEMIDGVKEFQTIFQMIFQSKIVNELLFEGGFDPTLNPDDEVEFVFHEIELDAKIKRENHIIQMFTQNAVTHEEMRSLMGLDPVMDEERLYFNMVTASLSAQDAEKAVDAANNQGDNKDQPENQNGKQMSPGRPRRTRQSSEDESSIKEQNKEILTNLLTEEDERVNLHSELRFSEFSSSLKKLWESFREDIIQMSKKEKSRDIIKGFAIETTRQSAKLKASEYITEAFMEGIAEARTSLGVLTPSKIETLKESRRLEAKLDFYFDRLIDDMETLIFKVLDEEKTSDVVTKVTGAFNSNEYRLLLIAKTELHRAKNYGIALVAKENNFNKVYSRQEGDKDCARCKAESKNPIELNDVDSLLDAIPPHHPNCSCTINLTKPVEEV